MNFVARYSIAMGGVLGLAMLAEGYAVHGYEPMIAIALSATSALLGVALVLLAAWVVGET